MVPVTPMAAAPAREIAIVEMTNIAVPSTPIIMPIPIVTVVAIGEGGQ